MIHNKHRLSRCLSVRLNICDLAAIITRLSLKLRCIIFMITASLYKHLARLCSGPAGAVMCFVQLDRQHLKQCVRVSTSNQQREVMYCTLTWNNAVCFFIFYLKANASTLWISFSGQRHPVTSVSIEGLLAGVFRDSLSEDGLYTEWSLSWMTKERIPNDLS